MKRFDQVAFLVCFGLAATGVSAAIPQATDITFSRATRGRVVVTYRLAEPAIVTFDVRTNGVSIGAANLKSVTGDVWRRVDAGAHRIVWNAKADWTGHRVTDGSLTVRGGALVLGTKASFKNLSLTNGPHKIEIALWNRQTAGGARTPTTKHPFWNVPDMGFAICLEGGTSTNAVDYIAPCNGTEGIVNPGGDGFYFTRDARWPEEITDAEREAFWEREQTMIAGVRLLAAGTLDLNGGTNSVSTLEGVGTVANGSLVVKDRLTLGYGETSGGQSLNVGGKLTFADGARIVFDGAFDKTPKDAQRNLTLVTAAEGIVNPPEIEDAAGNDRWRFAVSSDGKSLTAKYNPRGTMLIVR